MHWRTATLCLLVTITPAISIAQDASRRAKVDAPDERNTASNEGATPRSPLSIVPKVTHPLPELIGSLDDPDPLVRDRAREELMLLKRDELKFLQTAAKKAGPLTPTQLSSLGEVVMHVYLTDQHRFEGEGSGLIGIPVPFDTTEPVVISSRKIGYDSYRVLRDGDTIVGLQTRRGPGFGEMRSIENFEGLRAVMITTRAGDWLNIRVIRNGEPLEVIAHLAVNDVQLNRVANAGAANENPFLPQAQEYWERTFLPAISTATSRPATQSVGTPRTD